MKTLPTIKEQKEAPWQYAIGVRSGEIVVGVFI